MTERILSLERLLPGASENCNMNHETAAIVQTGVAARVYEVQGTASCLYQTERAGAYLLPSILVGLCNLHVRFHNDQHGIFLPLLDGACSRTFCIGFKAHRNLHFQLETRFSRQSHPFLAFKCQSCSLLCLWPTAFQHIYSQSGDSIQQYVSHTCKFINNGARSETPLHYLSVEN